MPKREIVIEIDVDGTVHIEGKNFVGPECRKFTEGLEKALGVVTRSRLKPEHRQAKPVARKAGA